MALTLLNDIPLRIRRSLLLYKVYGDSALRTGSQCHCRALMPFWLSIDEACIQHMYAGAVATLVQGTFVHVHVQAPQKVHVCSNVLIARVVQEPAAWSQLFSFVEKHPSKAQVCTTHNTQM